MRFLPTLGYRCHELAHLIMHRQAVPLGADDLPGPLTTSILRPSGGGTGARETDLLVVELSRAEWRAQRIDQLVRATDALMRYRPHLGDVVWEICLRRAPVLSPSEGSRGRRPRHDPEARADYADAAGIDVRTVDRWLQDAWEYLGVLWAEQRELDWALAHRQHGDIPLSDDDLLWALTTREELQQG